MLILCPFPQGVAAGQRLKYEQYLDDWRDAGWDVTVSPFMDMAMWQVAYEPGHLGAKALGVLRGYLRRIADLFRIGRFDQIYVHQWVTPIGPPLFERLVRTFAPRLVFDLEDNILAGQRNSGKAPNPLGRLLKGRGKASFLIRTADHVIASSPELAERCRDLNTRGKATYISSSVDTGRFLPATSYTGSEGLTIGWTGTHSTQPMLDLLRPVFQQLAERRRFKLRVIGNFPYELPGIDLEVLRWNAEQEVEQLQGIDIGVYPLPLDDEAWVAGKSGLKAIQYMAFALPIVATAVGHTPKIIRHEHNGLLVRSEAEWLAALERLLDDPALRRRLGQQARRDAEEKYSVLTVAGEYRRVLNEEIGNE